MIFKLNFLGNKTDLSLNKVAQQFTYSYSSKISGKVFKSFSNLEKFKMNSKIGGKLLILPLEHYAINRDKTICLVSQNIYIPGRTELIPNLFSKNEGLVQITNTIIF